MATKELLATYLDDHLAGATAGVDLAHKLAEDTEGTPMGPPMKQLASDIEADKGQLEALIDALDLDQGTVKRAAAWMAEKASRLRLNQVSAGSGALALLFSMEMLSAGIEGKRSLWQTLEEVAGAEPAVARLDLAALVQRAQAQHDVLERYRRAIALAATGCE
jgi:hypothetical protein